MGGNAIVFASIGSAPNVSDLEGGRRIGNFKDYCDLVRLCQSLNIVHIFGGYPVEPVDLPPATRHLDALHARSEEHTSELQSLMRISYAVFCLKKNKTNKHINNYN